MIRLTYRRSAFIYAFLFLVLTLPYWLGGEVLTYGRWNGAVSPDYSSSMFWMSNIGLILSPARLTHENLDFVGEEAGIHLYKVLSRMGDSLQITRSFNFGADQMLFDDPVKTLDESDVLEFEVTSGKSSILILIQKFHRDWQARALTPYSWQHANTLEINEVFQGVLLPSEALRVRLDFKPYVRYDCTRFLDFAVGFDRFQGLATASIQSLG